MYWDQNMISYQPRACLVSVFKHSFLCLNTENGGLGLKKICLVAVFTFCIQIQLLYN